MSVRTWDKWGQLTLLEKWKKNKNASTFLYLCYILTGQAGVKNGAMLTAFIYSDILQNTPFRSQICKIVFASGGKGALTS